MTAGRSSIARSRSTYLQPPTPPLLPANLPSPATHRSTRTTPRLLPELLQVGTIGGTEAVQVQIPAVAQGFLEAQKCLRCVLAVVTGEAYTLLAPGHPA